MEEQCTELPLFTARPDAGSPVGASRQQSDERRLAAVRGSAAALSRPQGRQLRLGWRCCRALPWAATRYWQQAGQKEESVQ